ncbi:ABC transporter ATP-binding protein [Ornithinibacillus halotolerans]|uniref:Daunorubicin resistance protein DrrA family ABC transporter ATP-binding protein n=1 Tax=Ornithinibacillus halotolerans TaxID=1274357 RepID=A0A916W8J9_9BACI|nr:ABC transporter ATP-binding protein [Ornithinibacillus halotolerans]GGA77960.1 daunorubicin resistance protein DrrA family ABC transporter ATP-binding protein [Ornithinibacillus halotolerans]
MKPIIEVSNLHKTYKKRKSTESVTAVNNVSFTVHQGEILGLLGPNGAGKSTTIKMICGLIKPDEGNITIKGIDNQNKRLKALNHISAVLEGNRNIYWRLTVRENLEYFAGNRGKSRREVASKIDDLLEKFKLKEKENELVNRLSRGMQQKLAIAVAMLAETEVILLDEPTLGIDVETGYEVRELLRNIAKEYNRTIIISSHDMDVIQDLCDRTIIINNGKVVTNDRVENLLRLFEVRSYTITFENQLSNKQLFQLQQKFPQLDYTPDTLQPKLEVNLSNSNEIYELFDILHQEQTPIETIDRKTINFEEVFLKIVKGESSHELVQSN